MSDPDTELDAEGMLEESAGEMIEHLKQKERIPQVFDALLYELEGKVETIPIKKLSFMVLVFEQYYYLDYDDTYLDFRETRTHPSPVKFDGAEYITENYRTLPQHLLAGNKRTRIVSVRDIDNPDFEHQDLIVDVVQDSIKMDKEELHKLFRRQNEELYWTGEKRTY